MKKLLVACLIAAAVLAVAGLSVATSTIQGGMTSNQSADTTYVFAPAVQGVQIINPDAECAFIVEFTGNGSTATIVITGNSSQYIKGLINKVTVAPTTTQRVGVYGAEPH